VRHVVGSGQQYKRDLREEEMLKDLNEDAALTQEEEEEEEVAIKIKNRTDHFPIVLFSVLYTPLALTISCC
jgi:hypothetical protein